ncbi:hypothetical protein AX769_04080 [Frondihabitans sp. PAMC 28766]|uniref:helix-turn-helix domain-containing protein n=1 Tax=Frondihabitans sp. PAMC 28766 TaxID=1795630 RepID=UPI00078B489C|nr:cupin domain-containing protein [Frondihabitans sp. PAMC 28766]AMM19471.1 hypothetical protein AX769_04080 [Frondihabitans sp. PAMC 28766]
MREPSAADLHAGRWNPEDLSDSASINKLIAARVEAARIDQGLSRDDVAATLGISERSYIRNLKGERPFNAVQLLRLSERLKVSVQALLDLSLPTMSIRQHLASVSRGRKYTQLSLSMKQASAFLVEFTSESDTEGSTSHHGEETIAVTSGTALLFLEGRTVEVGEGHSIRIPPNVPHSINLKPGCETLVVHWYLDAAGQREHLPRAEDVARLDRALKRSVPRKNASPT